MSDETATEIAVSENDPVSAEPVAPVKKTRGYRKMKGRKEKFRKTLGRPKHAPDEITRDQVVKLKVAGYSHDYIAQFLGISDQTLRKYYRDELEFGSAKKDMAVLSALYQTAIDTDHRNATQAQMFWLKSRMGWAEKRQVEITGKDGAPIQHQVQQTIDVSVLTRDQRDALREILMTTRNAQAQQLTQQVAAIEADDVEDGEFTDGEDDEIDETDAEA